jgi:hypothetical protein
VGLCCVTFGLGVSFLASNGDGFKPRKAAARFEGHVGRDGKKRIKVSIVAGSGAVQPGDGRQFMMERDYFIRWWNGEISFCYALEVKDSPEWVAAQAAKLKGG